MTRAPYVSFRVTPSGRRANAADIVAAVEREIAAGGLPTGSRLPPVRVLEQQLGLSKNTAQVAYDELVARGIAVTREREGVFIAEPPAGVVAAAPTALAPPLPRLRPPPVMGTGAPLAVVRSAGTPLGPGG